MLDHGGRLIQAAEKYQIPLENWIDLSTGINPDHWPIPQIPTDCFTRLPEVDDSLVAAAQKYFQVDNLLPVAGSQTAIQMLPRLRKKSRVAVPEVGYAEHAYQWQLAGHDVVSYKSSEIGNIISDVDVIILINPNNPTGETYSRKQLLNWHKHMQSHHGWLIVDEAFIDSEDYASMVELSNQSGLIVLRSIGKFFGLAGVRVGFVFAEIDLLNSLNEMTGHWPISGPSRYLTTKALLDTTWQEETIVNLNESSQAMYDLITSSLDIIPSGTNLFKTIMHEKAEYIFDLFARQGVLIRLLDNKKGIRLGLPCQKNWGKVFQVTESVFDIVKQQKHIENIRSA